MAPTGTTAVTTIRARLHSPDRDHTGNRDQIGTLIYRMFSMDDLSNLHLRRKRMLGHTAFRNNQWVTTSAIHIVKVLKNNVKICAGVIVSPYYILTPEKCVSQPGARYKVKSGAPRMSFIETHIVYDILENEELSLLFIHPPISVTSPSLNRQVELTEAALSRRMHTSIMAWDHIGERRPIAPVPIVNMITCGEQYLYHGHPITEDNVCTFQLCGRNRCSNEDVGSPLIVDDILFGVLLWAGSDFGPRVPDVFIRVNGNRYYNWLKQNV
ncbi:trypsin zeta-like [Belonocnema kinseyi]|uniref:trypsin zeta-like n=1 Tax=Belonocnema kinseyi TaxID=2817044 RepID=UPI00143D9C68|nr:trypsin zeta-like [Belonocnema kinseyi]